MFSLALQTVASKIAEQVDCLTIPERSSFVSLRCTKGNRHFRQVPSPVSQHRCCRDMANCVEMLSTTFAECHCIVSTLPFTVVGKESHTVSQWDSRSDETKGAQRLEVFVLMYLM